MTCVQKYDIIKYVMMYVILSAPNTW